MTQFHCSAPALFVPVAFSLNGAVTAKTVARMRVPTQSTRHANRAKFDA
jgi:hypothetical protein